MLIVGPSRIYNEFKKQLHSLIDKLLVKMYVLEIFITGDICHSGLASRTEEP